VRFVATNANGCHVLIAELLAKLRTRMWENGGYVAANDRVVARLLDLDVTVWRRTYKPRIEPMLTILPDAYLEAIYSQKTLVDLMIKAAEERIKNRDKTAAATAARKSKKSKQPASVTKTVTKQRHDDRNDNRDSAVTENVTVGKLRSLEVEQGSAPRAESPVLLSPTVDAAALPPQANGHAGDAADVGSPGLGGRSPPQPSEKIEPSPALLRTPLVKKARTGLMAALDSEEDIDE